MRLTSHHFGAPCVLYTDEWRCHAAPTRTPVKIYASSDHAGFDLRRTLVNELKNRGFDVDDRGPETPEPLDYPDEAAKVAHLVRNNPGSRGLLVCGSGIGMCISANRVTGARAVDAWNVESARLSRAHNDANILCLGARMIAPTAATEILETWLSTPFENGRHATRVAKIDSTTDRQDP
jgi:ribose 5-phosphate isomerase B